MSNTISKGALAWTRSTFRLTTLVYVLILIHAIILMIGGHYTYARVPLGQGSDEFLATQGDPFDTQSDMLMAWIGSMLAQVLLSRWHDRQLPGLPSAAKSQS